MEHITRANSSSKEHLSDAMGENRRYKEPRESAVQLLHHQHFWEELMGRPVKIVDCRQKRKQGSTKGGRDTQKTQIRVKKTESSFQKTKIKSKRRWGRRRYGGQPPYNRKPVPDCLDRGKKRKVGVEGARKRKKKTLRRSNTGGAFGVNERRHTLHLRQTR